LISVVDDAAAADVEYVFGPKQQDERTWVSRQGFQFRLDADNASRARFSLGDRGLTVETLAPAEPMLARGNINVAQPAQLTVTWGAERYAAGGELGHRGKQQGNYR
jgi:hypothetical protein